MVNRREFLVTASGAAGLAAVGPLQAAEEHRDIRISGLRIDYLEQPLGLDNPNPQLSWRLEASDRGVRQSAYRIWVASSESLAHKGQGDLWDSGKIRSSSSIGIFYAGKPLRSRARCWWCVQVWDQLDRPIAVSSVSGWEMGLLRPDDWTARWLIAQDTLAKKDCELSWIWGPKPDDRSSRRFRYVFDLPHVANRGLIWFLGLNPNAEVEYISGVWLDGTALDPTRFPRNRSNEPFVTGPLTAGKHCLAIDVEIRNYVPVPLPEEYGSQTPRFGIAGFSHFETAPGEVTRVASGAGWKTSSSSDSDWFKSNYNDTGWDQAIATQVEENQIPGPSVHLRRTFALAKAVKSARLYLSALGFVEAEVNGFRIGEGLMDPPPSRRDKRIKYRVHDIGEQLQPGQNAVGLTVTDGQYRAGGGATPPQAMAQIEVVLVDGSTQTIGTDGDWRVARGSLLRAHPWEGETQDARLKVKGWSHASFYDRSWEKATVAAAPLGRLVSTCVSPVRPMQSLAPRMLRDLGGGAYLFDFGQNIAGIYRLKVTGPPGHRLDVEFAEDLTSTGDLDLFKLFGGKNLDTYYLRGEASGEVFEPRFCCHGFRYIRITGLPSVPSKDDLIGIVIHNATAFAGQFRIDNPLIEQIWTNTVWSQRAYTRNSIFSQPSRPGPLGSLGDAAIFWDAATFNMDVAALTRSALEDAREYQDPSGVYDSEWPSQPGTFGPKTISAGFADGGIILPWTQWWRYGDTGIIAANWNAMNKYLRVILDQNPQHIWSNGHKRAYGDWLSIGVNAWYHPDQSFTTPIDLIATAYWARDTQLLAQMAEATGRWQETAQLLDLSVRIHDAFIRAFVRPDGKVGNGSQTAQILALQFGLLPEKLRPAAAEHLVADIRSRGTALSTGFLGTQFLLDVLVDAEYSEVVYSLLLRIQCPSWGYMINKGATTIWEAWDGALDHNRNEAEHNYYTLGSVCGFFFRRIAGINAVEPGFKKIIVRPVLDPLGRVRNGGADYDSIMGRISTDWTSAADGEFSLRVTIPANVSAQVCLPASRSSRISESGKEISLRKDMPLVERLDRETVIRVGSGSFSFGVIG